MSPTDNLRIAEAIRREAGVREFYPTPEPDDLYTSNPNWKSQGAFKIVYAPAGSTDFGLMVLAHECGHIATNPGSFDIPIITNEWNATKWGASAIRRNGGIVTPDMAKQAQWALASYLPLSLQMMAGIDKFHVQPYAIVRVKEFSKAHSKEFDLLPADMWNFLETAKL